MAIIKPFSAIRPITSKVANVAALPYDVVNRQEAKEIVLKEPYSFLKIDRAEVQFDDDFNAYDEKIYLKARDTLKEMIDNNIYIQDNQACYYIYQLTMNGRKQTGLVATASIDDYLNNIIKKHENTREEKEQDRIKHVDYCNAQTGPIFLAYREEETINKIVLKVTSSKEPIYNFKADDSIGHTVWIIDNKEDIQSIQSAFENINDIYIADGHHRAASAIKVGLKRREEINNYEGKEAFNYFLSVLFPHSELEILSYNRVIRDFNNYSLESFLQEIQKVFKLEKVNKSYQPTKKGTFGMYVKDQWYKLTLIQNINISHPVKKLDVSILQDYILSPILNIQDPRVDNRIDFVGGIRGLKELEKRVHDDMKVAFSMFPTAIEELFEVSDANLLMPPKSTWFEPKLRSGIFIHSL